MQRIVVTAGDAAQHLERVEGDGLRLMGADQLPEILLTAFETAKRGLPGLARLPLQKAQYPPAIVAGLHARTDKTVVALRQSFGLHRQRRDQRRLLAGLDFEFDQLGEAAVLR